MRIGVGIGIGMGANPVSFTAEYQAILTAGSAYTQPSLAEQNLQNQLIVDLKTAGIWAKLDAFYMFANNISTDSTGAFARINWKNPSANYGTAQGSGLPPISSKNGFTGNGTAGINLNYPHFSGTNFANPNGSIGVYYGTVQASTAAISTGAGGSRIRSGSSSSVTSSVITLTATANSFVHINRTSAAITAYLNGSSTGTSASLQPWATTDTSNFFIFWNGTSYGSSQIRVAFIGGNLAAEAATFNTLIQNYITAL